MQGLTAGYAIPSNQQSTMVSPKSSKQFVCEMESLREEVQFLEESIKRLFSILSPFVIQIPTSDSKDVPCPPSNLVQSAREIKDIRERIIGVRGVANYLSDNFQGN
jgi:hypothetical protein